MLLNLTKTLKPAYQNKFAIGAFNISNSELLKAVVETAEEKKSPAIIQLLPAELDLVGEDFIAYAREAAHQANVPIALHQDHCGEIEGILRAIRNGYTSVMVDGSHLPFEENIALTRQVVGIAHAVGVSVEAELGRIGENEGSIEGSASEVIYTNPEEAKEFVARTNCDALAVAVGTAHGLYPEHLSPDIKLDRLRQLNEILDVPLVLHGGSDNPDEAIRNTTKYGIAKINLSSDMKRAFFDQLRITLAEKPNDFEPNDVFPQATEAAKQVIREKMDVFGSTDKSHLYRLGSI